MARIDEDELIEHWTLIGGELAEVAGKRGPTRLAFALLLKFYNRRGRFPRGRGPGPEWDLNDRYLPSRGRAGASLFSPECRTGLAEHVAGAGEAADDMTGFLPGLPPAGHERGIQMMSRSGGSRAGTGGSGQPDCLCRAPLRAHCPFRADTTTGSPVGARRPSCRLPRQRHAVANEFLLGPPPLQLRRSYGEGQGRRARVSPVGGEGVTLRSPSGLPGPRPGCGPAVSGGPARSGGTAALPAAGRRPRAGWRRARRRAWPRRPARRARRSH